MANYVPTKCIFRSSKKEFFEQWQKDKELIDGDVYSYLDENAHDLFEKYQIEDSSFTWESDCKLPSESVIRTDNEYMEAELWYSGVWIPAPQAAYCLADALAQKAGIKKTDVQVIITIIMFEMCFVMTTDPAFKGKVLTKLDCDDIPMFDDICAKGADDYWVSTILDTNQFLEPSEMLKKIKKIIKDNKLEGYEDLGKNFKYSPNYETETVLFGGAPDEKILALLDFESRFNSNNKNSIGIYFLVFTEKLPSRSPAHYDTFKRFVSLADDVSGISISEAIDCLKTLKPGEHTLHIYGDAGEHEYEELSEALSKISDDIIINLDLSEVTDEYNDWEEFKTYFDGFETRKIKSLVLPSNIHAISRISFAPLPFIESITIPANVDEILSLDDCIGIDLDESYCYDPDCEFNDDNDEVDYGYTETINLFNFNVNLKEIIVDENNEFFSAEEGVLYNKDKTELIACSPAKSGKFIVPDTVKKICDTAFGHCKKLKEIVLPEGLEIIEHHAFILCTSLKTINIPNSVTEIGETAFSGCSNLSSIMIPESITILDRSVFYKCEKLLNVTIPDSVTEIGEYAFSGCTGLTDIIISDSVKEIGQDAFFGCTGLTDIIIPDSVTKIGYNAFTGCINLKNIKLPNYIVKIDEGVFFGCTNLANVTLPHTIKSIGDKAFIGCSSLEEIVYDGTIKEWNKIKIFDFFESVFEGVPAKVIKCKDGEVEIEQEDDVE